MKLLICRWKFLSRVLDMEKVLLKLKSVFNNIWIRCHLGLKGTFLLMQMAVNSYVLVIINKLYC